MKPINAHVVNILNKKNPVAVWDFSNLTLADKYKSKVLFSNFGSKKFNALGIKSNLNKIIIIVIIVFSPECLSKIKVYNIKKTT